MPPKTRSTTARRPVAKRSPKRKRVKVRSPITNNPFKRFAHTCLIGFTPAQRRAARANLDKARQAKRSR